MEVSLPVASQRGVVYPHFAPYTRCTRLRSATAEGPTRRHSVQNQQGVPYTAARE